VGRQCSAQLRGSLNKNNNANKAKLMKTDV